MELQKTLNWRYAVKKYSDRKITDNDLQKIIEAVNLSASSAGMQPYRLFVIENSQLRQELGADSFNPQITESSHLLAFAAYENVTQEMINEYILHIAETRAIPVEQLEEFKGALGFFLGRTPEENFIWSSRQAYIALGTALIAAAELKIDTTPMEGFNAQKLDELLGLNEKGLKSVVLLSIGYRDEEKDAFAKLKKVRLPKEVLATVV